ncbi:MAG: c-type cytochrome [Hyphomicrobiales bacterium]
MRKLQLLGAIAITATVVLAPPLATAQDAEEKAIATRQGYMKIVGWEAGPLFAMLKGEMEYNAEAAKKHAANLKLISQYPVAGLFMKGTSNEDRKGKTRSLPKIWQDMDGFGKALTDWQAAVAALEGKVGNGQAELAAAVGALGKSCGGCHKPYRADEF